MRDLAALARVAGRISIARTQRGSVRPVCDDRRHHVSCAPGLLRPRRGLDDEIGLFWPNWSAKFQPWSSGHFTAAGMSFGSPFGAPASIHADDRLDLLVAQRAVVLELLDADRLVDAATAASGALRRAPGSSAPTAAPLRRSAATSARSSRADDTPRTSPGRSARCPS